MPWEIGRQRVSPHHHILHFGDRPVLRALVRRERRISVKNSSIGSRQSDEKYRSIFEHWPSHSGKRTSRSCVPS